MAEWRMSDVVRERRSLSYFRIKAAESIDAMWLICLERAFGQSPCNLCDLY